MKHIKTLYDWRDIKGQEGRYQVNQFGQVRNAKTKRILKLREARRYLTVDLRDANGIKRKYRVHRLVAQAFIPNPDNFDTVDHLDFNNFNNFAINLRWMPHIENSVRHKPKSNS